MLVSGILTCTMLYAAIAPQASLLSTFGESLDGELADLIVRNWGILIALVGGMLIYGAYHPLQRPLVLVVACIGKICFISLVLSEGERFLSYQAGPAIVVDSIMVLLFAWYLVATRNERVEKESGNIPS